MYTSEAKIYLNLNQKFFLKFYVKKKCQIYVCEKFKVYANFQTQKVSILTDIPWPRKLDAETHIQEKVDKRDESVKVNILECIF